MKLRFRGNSLRLRLNRREVEALASGAALEERVIFPGDDSLAYVLEPSKATAAKARFQRGVIRVSAPQVQVSEWASGTKIGLYFDLPANGSSLKIAIEKDLECVDGSPDEADVDAFPRGYAKIC
ncbi:MAG TPA: hypothetical protein VGL97_24745 [Bryobacteraceae bacterium]|jgi:hypothetical protein